MTRARATIMATSMSTSRGISDCTPPDARELHDIRNALEHKYLQVHEGWARGMGLTPIAPTGLGLSIDSDLLESKALRVMKIARAALIQLATAVGVEERERAATSNAQLVSSMNLYALKDMRKRRDPDG